MIRIYLCDDDEQDTMRVCRMLACYAKPFHVRVTVRKFKSAARLLAALQDDEPKPDLIFLDIFIDGTMDGVEAGERLRAMGLGQIPVIFSTSSGEHAIDAFRLHAAGYLKKPYTQQEFNHAMKRLEGLFLENRRALSVEEQEGKKARQVSLRDILYLEASDRGTVIHLTDGILKSAAPLKGYREQLAESAEFYSCGRSFIINLNYAGEMTEAGIRMDGGETVPVPLRLRAELAVRVRQWRSGSEPG